MVVTPLFPPQIGGASSYFNLVVDGLSKIETITDIIVLTTFNKNSRIYEDKNKLKILRILPPTNFSLPNYIPIRMMFLMSVLLCSFVLSIMCVLIFSINLVHSHTISQYSGGIFASKLLGIPVITDLRDLGSRATVFKQGNILICSSLNTVNYAKKYEYPPKNVEYIPLPFKKPNKLEKSFMEQVIKQYGIPSEKTILCYVSDIIGYKGIYELLDAFEIIKNKKPNYLLIIIGENREGKKFLEKIKGKKKILYLGPLPHKKVIALIQNSEILVLPSKSENLPRVCLEAIYLGIKVVCPPNVPEFDKYCPNNIFKKIEPKVIANKIEDVISKEETISYPFELHDPNKNIQQIYKIYMKLLGS